MKAILITGGVGDLMAVESLMTNEERQSIDCIFYATRAAAPCIELLTNIKTFSHLKKQVSIWKNFTNIFGFIDKQQLVDKLCAYQPNELQDTVKRLMEQVEDYSIAKIFIEKRNYHYSSFVNVELACIKKFNLPKRYYCICPYSNNDKRDIRRNYTHVDWAETINILIAKNIHGVVINAGVDPIPNNPILINLNYKTTIREAVEMVKHAQGYIGIDSAFSVIATKVCNPEDIIIKSHNDHCYNWKHIYFAPQTNFNFLRKSIIVQ